MISYTEAYSIMAIEVNSTIQNHKGARIMMRIRSIMRTIASIQGNSYSVKTVAAQ